MDRRGFLETSGLGVLGLAAGSRAARAEEEPRRFEHIRDFTGKWVGNYDGRNARMAITVKPHDGGDPGAFAVTIIFDELDRDERYHNSGKGGIHVEKTEETSHILRDIELIRTDGEDKVHLKRLYLHTWNAAYLSGISEWGGTEFGLSFKREGA